VEAGAGRVAALLGGIGGQVGAGAWGKGVVTLCDRSPMAAFIGSRAPGRAGQVGMVWTACWMLPNWGVMRSSGRVMDASAFRAEQERGTRIISPSDSSESCLSSRIGSWTEVKLSRWRVS